MNNILIVEDEPAIGNLIRMHLTMAGYQCRHCLDGHSAIKYLESHCPDLVLLDIMLPGIDGYELMEYIRPLTIPVIFLTAKNDVLEKVKGLRLGADDYIVKPFEMVELLARIETVLRRYNKITHMVELLGVSINFDARMVQKEGKTVDLTAKEFGLLAMFVQNKNVALFRDMLYERVWEKEFTGDSRTVDLHVQRLRKKLGWENNLVAVHGIGYRLEVAS